MSGADDDEGLPTDTPPLRYGIVEDHPPLYRGSYPHSKNLNFLQRLRLKTILSLTPEPLGEEIATWCSAQGVRMMHLKISKEKKKKKHPIGFWEAKQALQIIISRVHQPLYLHCMNGSEVTSLIVACLRKLQCWSVSSTMAEFGRFCLVTPAHTSFIETFNVEIEITRAAPRWLFRGYGRMGNEGIIAEHPTLKLKYSDPDMARTAAELREQIALEREEHRLRHEHEQDLKEDGLVDGKAEIAEREHGNDGHIDHSRKGRT